jgi:predicted transcriptional regulator
MTKDPKIKSVVNVMSVYNKSYQRQILLSLDEKEMDRCDLYNILADAKKLADGKKLAEPTYTTYRTGLEKKGFVHAKGDSFYLTTTGKMLASNIKNIINSDMAYGHSSIF